MSDPPSPRLRRAKHGRWAGIATWEERCSGRARREMPRYKSDITYRIAHHVQHPVQKQGRPRFRTSTLDRPNERHSFPSLENAALPSQSQTTLNQRLACSPFHQLSTNANHRERKDHEIGFEEHEAKLIKCCVKSEDRPQLDPPASHGTVGAHYLNT